MKTMVTRREAHRSQEASVDHQLALDVVNLRYRYDKQRPGTPDVLNDVNLQISKGEFVAIMGPSGCGKSTLLSIVAGFTRPAGGSVSCAGVPVDRPGADRGVVFQQPSLYPWLSVFENVAFGLRARHIQGDVKTLAKAMIAQVGLAGFESYKTYELSGGMQSRVALARTLVNEPTLLLMDEPFAALDAQTRSDMQELVLRIRELHQSSVMFVTHDIEEGLLLADRVVVLGGSPSGVVEVIKTDAPRPRTHESIADPRFNDIRKHLRDLFREDPKATNKGTS